MFFNIQQGQNIFIKPVHVHKKTVCVSRIERIIMQWKLVHFKASVKQLKDTFSLLKCRTLRQKCDERYYKLCI